jgi:hypothetical protein
MSERRARVTGATAVAALAFAVYLRTLYPGLVMFGDSPKFQFVGHIWGTPHNPGYPLYIVVSHLFGLLPFGTLAYRINLMSAVFGAAAAAVMVLVVARLTRSTWAGIAAGLGLAFGRVFWSQAIVAEVYTLATTLLLATIYVAVRWTETRAQRDLLIAIGLAALAVGNHLTIVMFAPGLILLVLMTDWRAALRARVVVIGAGLLVAGLAQYLLIVFLTRRGAPYLESSARTVRELLPIVAGAEFQSRLGHFGWRELFTSRTSQLFGLVLEETGMWGIALAAIGLAVMLRRRRGVALGLLAGAGCVWAFLLDYDVADPQVFLIPVFVVTWIFAGAAAAALVQLTARTGETAATLAGFVLAAATGSALYVANLRVNDHHGRTFEAQMMNAVFLELPTHAIVAWGSFQEQLLLQYKLFGEAAGEGRGIRESGVDAARLKEAFTRDTPVYAMSQARDQLVRSGFVFEPVPLRLPLPGDPVLFRTISIRECRDIAQQGWIDVSTLVSGGRVVARIDNYRPFDSDLWLVVGSDSASAPRLGPFTGPNPPTFTVRTVQRLDEAGLRTSLADAGFDRPAPETDFVTVVHVRVNDNGDFAVLSLDLGGPARSGYALGTTDLKSNPKRLTVCPGDSM